MMHTARKMKFWAETPTSSIKKYEPPFECILHINQKASIFSKMWFEILDMKLSYLSEFIAFTKFTLEGHGINKPSVRFPSKKSTSKGMLWNSSSYFTILTAVISLMPTFYADRFSISTNSNSRILRQKRKSILNGWAFLLASAFESESLEIMHLDRNASKTPTIFLVGNSNC